MSILSAHEKSNKLYPPHGKKMMFEIIFNFNKWPLSMRDGGTGVHFSFFNGFTSQHLLSSSDPPPPFSCGSSFVRSRRETEERRRMLQCSTKCEWRLSRHPCTSVFLMVAKHEKTPRSSFIGEQEKLINIAGISRKIDTTQNFFVVVRHKKVVRSKTIFLI